MNRNGDHSVLAGMAAGLVGGLVGSWTMNLFQTLWSKLAQSQQGQQQQTPQEPSPEPATVLAAQKISQLVLHRDLEQDEKKVAEPLVHYGYGTIMGGIYGALAEVTSAPTKAVGLPFGAVLWLAGDEIAVPAFGLSKPATEYPASTHLQSLAAHFVYGLTTDMVRRAMLIILD